MHQKIEKIVHWVAALAFAALPAFSSGPILAGENPAKTPAAKAQTAKTAMTAEQHLARSAEYSKKAAGYRREADVHRKMLQEYALPRMGSERPDEDPDVVKMSEHCGAYIEKADALAAEAQKFADYHRIRAGELRGQ